VTLGELLEALESALPGRVMRGDASATLAAAHDDAVVGPIVVAIARKSSAIDPLASIDRAAAVTALAPLRLAAMRDDAPAEHLRVVERAVQAIDAAFNEESFVRAGQGTRPPTAK